MYAYLNIYVPVVVTFMIDGHPYIDDLYKILNRILFGIRKLYILEDQRPRWWKEYLNS